MYDPRCCADSDSNSWHTAQWQEEYERLLGHTPAELGIRFWDAVAITAGSECQADSIRERLAEKCSRDELPRGVPFFVIPDPPHHRVGDGGATLNACRYLMNRFGENVVKLNILIIHSGGYSKRLPHMSAESKIFTPLPRGRLNQGCAPMTMLDVKLFIYWPFMTMGLGGFFVTASDDIETFSIRNEDWTRVKEAWLNVLNHEPALVSLCHPSSMSLGENHGVFKIRQSAKQTFGQHLTEWISDCEGVWQKPSISTMRQEGVVWTDKYKCEKVFTDSMFWINEPLALKLLRMKDISKLDEEFSIYADFMAFQRGRGCSNAMSQYRKPTNPSKIQIELMELASKVPLYLVALHESKFHHIGTGEEYLTQICQPKSTLSLALRFNLVQTLPSGGGWVCMNSILGDFEKCSPNVIISNSVIEVSNLIIFQNTIVSHCHIPASFEGNLGPSMVYFTLRISDLAQDNKFVTVVYHMTENFKKVHINFHTWTESTKFKRVEGTVFTNDVISSWNAKLFPISGSKSDSFANTLNVLIRQNAKRTEDQILLSLHDLALLKGAHVPLEL